MGKILKLKNLKKMCRKNVQETVYTLKFIKENQVPNIKIRELSQKTSRFPK